MAAPLNVFTLFIILTSLMNCFVNNIEKDKKLFKYSLVLLMSLPYVVLFLWVSRSQWGCVVKPPESLFVKKSHVTREIGRNEMLIHVRSRHVIFGVGR